MTNQTFREAVEALAERFGDAKFNGVNMLCWQTAEELRAILSQFPDPKPDAPNPNTEGSREHE